MHPVIEHLLARQGQAVPISDGRKITLVLWGGIMRSVRCMAAMTELSDLGLTHAFDEIYTVSAGFPVASYFLSEQIRLCACLGYEELASRKFLNRWRFWHAMNMDYLIEAMRTRKPLDVKKILAGKTKLYVRLAIKPAGAREKRREYLEIHQVGEEHYFKLLEASSAVPILRPRPVQIDGAAYADTNINGHLHEHLVTALASDATDVLIIYSAAVQRRVRVAHSSRVFEICPPKEWKLSRFEINPEVLQKAAQQMGAYVKSFFGKEEGVVF